MADILEHKSITTEKKLNATSVYLFRVCYQFWSNLTRIIRLICPWFPHDRIFWRIYRIKRICCCFLIFFNWWTDLKYCLVFAGKQPPLDPRTDRLGPIGSSAWIPGCLFNIIFLLFWGILYRLLPYRYHMYRPNWEDQTF